MFEIRTEIEIDVSAEAVWAVLIDVERFAEWNPFLKRVEGTLAVGEVLNVWLQLGSGRAVRIRPRVTRFEPGRALAWRGQLGRGLFRGDHSYELSPLSTEPTEPTERCLFVHRESFSGPLVPWVRRLFAGPTQAAFAGMNRALKARAELLSGRGAQVG